MGSQSKPGSRSSNSSGDQAFRSLWSRWEQNRRGADREDQGSEREGLGEGPKSTLIHQALFIVCRPFIVSIICAFVSIRHPPIHSFVHAFTHSFISSFTHSSVRHFSIYSFSYVFLCGS